MYDNYLRVVSEVKSKYDPFKSNREYMGILEHVSPQFGEEYLKLLYSEIGMAKQEIIEFCKQNDSFGNPNTYLIGDLGINVSPTSLRYLYHASLILKHAGKSDRFVEVGGGYGGLFLALTYLSKTPIREYHLVDLEPVINLQRIVLDDYTNVFYHSSNTFGSDVPDNCFLISNYCFSEISLDLQKKYIENLICRCLKGFLAWNTIPCYNFGKRTIIEQERPLTFGGNYFVYF